MSVTDTLLKAADLIEQIGWSNGSFIGENGELCAYEAIWQAATNISSIDYDAGGKVNGPEGVTLAQHNAMMWAGMTFQRWLKENNKPPTIARWNDSSTKDEVVAGLRDCAMKDKKD
jgi:hypothetical protein